MNVDKIKIIVSKIYNIKYKGLNLIKNNSWVSVMFNWNSNVLFKFFLYLCHGNI